MVGLEPKLGVPGGMETFKEIKIIKPVNTNMIIQLTVPRMLGKLVTSMRPTSHVKVFVTESNEYLP